MSTEDVRVTTIRFTPDMAEDSLFLRDYFGGQGIVISETELIRIAYRHLRRSVEARGGKPLLPAARVVEAPQPMKRGRKPKDA